MRGFISLIFVHTVLSIFSQDFCNYKIEFSHLIRYELIFRPDSTDLNRKLDSSFDLYSGNSCSAFFNSFKTIKGLKDYLEKFGKPNPLLLKDKRNSISENYTLIPWDDFYKVKEKNTFRWVLDDSIKNVKGYLCKKATTNFRGRTWTAWYTEEIPISDGPYKFYGLPGLIIELYDNRNDYMFTAYEVIKLDIEDILRFKVDDAIRVSKIEFLRRIEDNGSSKFKQNGYISVGRKTDDQKEEDITPKPIKLKNLIELTDENGKRIVLK